MSYNPPPAGFNNNKGLYSSSSSGSGGDFVLNLGDAPAPAGSHNTFLQTDFASTKPVAFKDDKLDFLSFSPSNPTNDTAGVFGQMQASPFDSGIKGGKSFITQPAFGSNFFTSKGFGWLLETEDSDEEQKPLLEELDIDLKDIFYKVSCVLLPLPYFRLKIATVRDNPDFWGPLLVVLFYALLSLYGQVKVVSWVMTIWFGGSFVIFFLARVLGGEVGYAQCLGIVGYCLIPLVFVAALGTFLVQFHYASLLLRVFGVLWAVYSAGILLCGEDLKQKRSLLLYPVCLLYIYFLSLYTGV